MECGKNTKKMKINLPHSTQEKQVSSVARKAANNECAQGAGAGVGSWARAAVVAARWLSEGGFGFGCVGVLGCVGSGSGVIKPAGLALLTAL